MFVNKKLIGSDLSRTCGRVAELGERVLAGGAISREEALYLLGLTGPGRYVLFHWSNQIREAFLGLEVGLCGIASAKMGQCSEDCRFCAQSGHYSSSIGCSISDKEELLEAAKQAAEMGVHCFGLVSSGRGPSDSEIELLGEVLGEICALGLNLTCCAALGCLEAGQAERLYELGVRRYNHNLETSERYFPQVVTTHCYDDRVRTVRLAKAAGMAVCCGGILGLGESLADRVDLALALRELGVDGVPLNFLHAIEGTPFAGHKPMDALEALQAVAVFRFVLPDCEIKVAGGREKCLRDLRSWVFYAGANSLMVGNYLTTAGRNYRDDLQMISDLGLSKR